MKKVLFIGLVFSFLFLPFVSSAAEYSCEDAAKHIGEKGTVCGKVVDTMPYQGVTILGLGKGVMEQGAVGIEVDDSLKEKLDKDLYVGKEICVTGDIHQNPSNGASIKVTDSSQIKVKK
jgi:hypothetical protein